MKAFKVVLPRQAMYAAAAYVCLFLNAVGGDFCNTMCGFIYLFCFGTAAKKIFNGISCLFRLKPNSNAIGSAVNVISFTVLIASFVIDSLNISGVIPACICSLLTTTHDFSHSVAFESTFFSVSVIFAAVAGVTAIIISNKPATGCEYLLCCLCAVGAARGIFENI